MVCRSCRLRLARRGEPCPACASVALDLVAADGRRTPVRPGLSIGRDPSNDLVLEDPGVSRRHAVVRTASFGGFAIEDCGSRGGTFVEGERAIGPARLRDGDRVRVGGIDLRAERVRDAGSSGHTVIVRPGSVLAGSDHLELALKRLEAAEGTRRWTLQAANGGAGLRLDDADAELAGLLDGSRSLDELGAYAEARFGDTGRPRLVRLLVALHRQGLAGDAVGAPRQALWRRLLRPREASLRRPERLVALAYRRGGWTLFTRPVLTAAALVAVLGLVAFALLLARGSHSPLRIGGSFALGGAVFIGGRLGLIAAHELAHALTLASYGRPVRRAGVRLVLVFPAAFVDTAAAWFEPRRRRIAVAAAGPASDLTLGGAFALAALLLPFGGAAWFQLAVAGYTGALLNLNPCVERDGYHVLADALDEPNLRRRAQEELARRVGGRPGRGGAVVLRYALAGLTWSAVAGALAAAAVLRASEHVRADVPASVGWAGAALVGLLCMSPVLLNLALPAVARVRARTDGLAPRARIGKPFRR
jgi:putative peptide zinc metalloprotease protein